MKMITKTVMKSNPVTEIILYNKNEVPQINGQLIQRPPLRKHNIVYLVHRHHGGKWVRATLLSNELRGYGHY